VPVNRFGKAGPFELPGTVQNGWRGLIAEITFSPVSLRNHQNLGVPKPYGSCTFPGMMAGKNEGRSENDE
jgi:hypothetical protein